MKRIICLSIIGLFVFGGLKFTLAQNTEEKVQAVDVGNKICPVSGEKIDEKITYEYQGKIYHFCCLQCIEDFKKDPEKYIKKVEEELKAQDKEEPKKMKLMMPKEEEMPMKMQGEEGHQHHHH